jgi:hypothetical protein
MKTIQWFTDSPDCGDPACICSWCGRLIAEKDAPAIRLFDAGQNKEIRFHRACIGPAIWSASTAVRDFATFDDQELQ